MNVEIAELLAERDVDLHAGDAVAEAVGSASCRDDETDSWRHGGRACALLEDLVSIIQEDVADTDAAVRVGKRDRVRKLIPHAPERPLLRDGSVPLSVAREAPREDVLEDVRFLIERFFDEEGVVQDLELARRILR